MKFHKRCFLFVVVIVKGVKGVKGPGGETPFLFLRM